MHTGQLVFSQLMEFLPRYEFAKCVQRYHGNRRVRRFRCWDQFLVMAFAQLTFRESLRDIETCLRAAARSLSSGVGAGIRTLHAGRGQREPRLAHLGRRRAGAHHRARRLLHADENFDVPLKANSYAFDTTTIDLCLTLFPWAQFRRHKSAVKMHTLLDLRGNIPCFINITSGAVHEVNALDELHFWRLAPTI